MEILTKVVIALGAVVLMGLLTALPIMWLWNWLMPEIFGLVTITFWQSLGLALLSSLLLKNSSNSNK